MELGSAADWFSAVGTVGALLLGLRLYRRDLRAKETAQASMIHAYVAPGASGAAFEYEVTNNSDLPVYDLNLVRWWMGKALRYEKADIRRRTEAFAPARWRLSPHQDPFGLGTLRPGESKTFLIPRGKDHNFVKCQLLFRDASGRRWGLEVDTNRGGSRPRLAAVEHLSREKWTWPFVEGGIRAAIWVMDPLAAAQLAFRRRIFQRRRRRPRAPSPPEGGSLRR